DFGLSHVKERSVSEVGFYGCCGTPCYMAPEVISKQKYGLSCDIFSFGVVCCEMLTGFYPFDSQTIKQKAGNVPTKTTLFEAAIVQGLRAPIPSDAPPAFKQLIADCWIDQPHNRPTIDHVL